MELGENAYSGDEAVHMSGSKMDEIIAGEFAMERELRDAEEVAKAAEAASKKSASKTDEK